LLWGVVDLKSEGVFFFAFLISGKYHSLLKTFSRRRVMRARTLIPLMIALLLFAGCSSISVVSDYDSTLPLAGYKTYRWTDNAGAGRNGNILAENPLILKRIKSAVDKEFAGRGYRLDNNAPVDFTLAVYAGLRERVYYEPPPPGFYYHRGFHGRYGYYDPFWWGPYARYYDEGTLGIDIFDNRTGRLAWHGVGRGIVNDYRNGYDLQRDIDEAVSKILAEFPPQNK
jgi:hypothetical protein